MFLKNLTSYEMRATKSYQNLIALIVFIAFFSLIIDYIRLKHGQIFDVRNFETEEMSMVVKELREDIFAVSPAQSLIAPEYIIKTIKFMLKDVDEDDPELIDFVRSVIVAPSKEQRTLKNEPSDRSQFGQSKYIDTLLKHKRNGFFIEAGGHDGESLSNSLFFELERGWSGLLIEPIPYLYKKLASKNRKVFSINACIADKKPFVAKFRAVDFTSGRENEMNKVFLERVNEQTNNKANYIYIPCFSLYTILKAINVLDVDYFSLDVEGGEWSVIKSINFNKIKIKSFTIEYAGGSHNSSMLKKLQENNFQLLKDDGADYYFKNINFL